MLQKGLLNSRKASASNVPRNDNKKSDRKNEKVDHTERAGENLAAGSAETEITVTMFYRLPTYSAPIKRTPFSDINNPKQ